MAKLPTIDSPNRFRSVGRFTGFLFLTIADDGGYRPALRESLRFVRAALHSLETFKVVRRTPSARNFSDRLDAKNYKKLRCS